VYGCILVTPLQLNFQFVPKRKKKKVVSVIWASVMPVTFEKWLESLWCISSFDSHLSTYGNLFLVVLDSCFWCSLFMGVWRLWMAPLYVAIGNLLAK
jgi:hypothetical protein